MNRLLGTARTTLSTLAALTPAAAVDRSADPLCASTDGEGRGDTDNGYSRQDNRQDNRQAVNGHTDNRHTSSSGSTYGVRTPTQSDGWNWTDTCDHDFCVQHMQVTAPRTPRSYRSMSQSRPPVNTPRPPSLCLLEDVFMPAVGQSCAVRTGVSTGTGERDSQTLLAAIDEGISFLRERYPNMS